MEPLDLNSPVQQLAHDKRFSPYYKNPHIRCTTSAPSDGVQAHLDRGPSSCIAPLSRAVIFLTVPQRLTFGLIPPLPRRSSVLARHVRDAHRTDLIHAPDAPGRARGRCTPATLFAGRVHKRPRQGNPPLRSRAAVLCLLYLSNEWDRGGRVGRGRTATPSVQLPLFLGAPLQDFPQEILGAAGAE